MIASSPQFDIDMIQMKELALIALVLLTTDGFGKAADWRKIEGVVYRLPLAEGDGWHHFYRAEVTQVLGLNAILFSLPNRSDLFMLTNYPSTARLIDGAIIDFWAKETGIFEYKTVLGANSRVIRFDHGTEPSPNERNAAQRRLEQQEEQSREAEAQRKEAEERRLKAIRVHQAAERAKREQVMKAKVVAFQKEQAARGLPGFQYELGVRYLSGDGVETNEAEAIRLLKAASKQGHQKAQQRLKELGQ